MAPDQVIAILKQHASTQNVHGMAGFGIRPAHALGIAMPTLRNLAKKIGKNHPVEWAEEIKHLDSKTARWIAKDRL